MNRVTEKKEQNTACSGCCHSCKIKKIETTIKLVPAGLHKNDVKQGE